MSVVVQVLSGMPGARPTVLYQEVSPFEAQKTLDKVKAALTPDKAEVPSRNTPVVVVTSSVEKFENGEFFKSISDLNIALGRAPQDLRLYRLLKKKGEYVATDGITVRRATRSEIGRALTIIRSRTAAGS